MRISVDTNVLVRVATEDDEAQAKAAQRVMTAASEICISTQALCEFVWVLSQRYKISAPDIAAQIRLFAGAHTAVIDRPAVEAGLAMLDAGGDFADGVIAYEGEALGADEFVSFDKRAVTALKARGVAARLLG